jgi:predicted nucleic acid-binding protein
LTIYADSSFFVSLYLVDAHSKEAWRRMLARRAVWITPLNRAEFTHAVFLQVFWKKAVLAEAEGAMRAFNRDEAAGVWQTTGLPAEGFERSMGLAKRFGPSLGVRTLDSLHVACALELKAERFWTFDERQARLAKAVGLKTSL